MKIDLPIDWNDEVGELFDKITLLTLKDAYELIGEQQEELEERLAQNDLASHESEDYAHNVHLRMALATIIKYFGG